LNVGSFAEAGEILTAVKAVAEPVA
jgi:hypothetical protein